MLWAFSIRRLHICLAVLCGFFAVGSSACSGGSATLTPPAPDPALQNALKADLADYLATRSSIEHISTLSMTVSLRDNPSDINLAVGTTTYGGGVTVTPSNLFQIGSNTKAFTSVVILQLEAAGVLSLGDTLGKWLPQYPAWSNVTIRQLLNMTSGIPTYDGTPAWEMAYSGNPLIEFTPAQLVDYVYPSIQTPGAAFEYSNTGYILAQMIVDKASVSHSYETELNNLFARTGLKDTFYAPYFYPASVSQRLVAGYLVNTDDPGLSKLFGKDTSGFSLGWTQAAGGMLSTPEALTTWVRELFEGNVLPAKQRSELQSLVAIPSGQPIAQTSASQPQGFSLGLFQITDPTLGLFWGYQGSTSGFRAAYSYIPSSGLIITIFTNSQTTAVTNTLSTVLFPNVYNTLKAAGKV